MRPVGSELEFHWNASHHSKDEADAKDLCPEARGLVIPLIVFPQSDGFQRHHQRSKSHGQLRKKVVEGDGECEMQPMYQYGGVHEEHPTNIIYFGSCL